MLVVTLFLKIYFIEVQLIYNIVLISAVQKMLYIYIRCFSYSFPLWFITGY